VGTFGFMAPEQFQGRAGPSSDVYAVGATALSLLTGREPEDLPHKGLSVDVESALRGQVDRRLVSALVRMLEPDPDKRARSVEDALRAAGLADGASARASSPPPAGSAAEAKAARRERLRERFPETEDEQADRYSTRAERRARKYAERAERRANKYAERAERRANKHAHRVTRRFVHNWRRPGPPVPPGLVLGIVILFALRIASVATFALFSVLLPLLFTLLQVPGRRQRMLEIGQAGQRGLARAREHIRYQFMGGPIPPELERFLRDHDIDPDAESRSPFANRQSPSANRQGPFANRQDPFAPHTPSSAPRQRVSYDPDISDPAARAPRASTDDAEQRVHDERDPEEREHQDSDDPRRARR
jgi:hypothetical protein